MTPHTPHPTPGHFFFSMLRLPPRSTLFPTRRSSDLQRRVRGGNRIRRVVHRELAHVRRGVLRSEEHTSELQSLAYLVCRLLLEKKKSRKRMVKVTFSARGVSMSLKGKEGAA